MNALFHKNIINRIDEVAVLMSSVTEMIEPAVDSLKHITDIDDLNPSDHINPLTAATYILNKLQEDMDFIRSAIDANWRNTDLNKTLNMLCVAHQTLAALDSETLLYNQPKQKIVAMIRGEIDRLWPYVPQKESVQGVAA